MLWVEGICRIFENRLPIVIYTGHSFLSPAKFERCVSSDMKNKGRSVFPTLSVDWMSVSPSSPSDISHYLCLPPPVRSMNVGILAFRWCMAVQATLRGIHKMLGVSWLLHQPSHAFDDVLTPVFDRGLVIVIPSHVLESVQFPLRESLIIGHVSHKLLDAIPGFEAWETQSGLFFFQHIVIVRLHVLLLDPTLDIFVHFKRGKRVLGIAL